MLGLCTGSLAAAAVSLSNNLQELVPHAVHAVVIALHTGLASTNVAQSIVGEASAKPWSMVVVGCTLETATRLLDRFNSSKVRSIPLAFHFQR